MNRIKFSLIGIKSVFAIWGMLLLSIATTNAADPLTSDQKKVFEELIRDYLIKNPDIILKSMEKLRER